MEKDVDNGLLMALRNAYQKLVEARANELLEDDLNEGEYGRYLEGVDRDSVNVGVGQMTVREEVVQNEDLAYEDAECEVIDEILNGDDSQYELFQNTEFTTALKKFLETC